MKTQMPIWLFVITPIIFIIIGIAGIIMFFKTQSYKKSVLIKNDALPPLKQFKLKWYKVGGLIFGFLISIVMVLGLMSGTGMLLA